MPNVWLCGTVLAFIFLLKVQLLSSLPTFISRYYIKITTLKLLISLITRWLKLDSG